MASEIRLAEEIEGFTEGVVVSWLKQVGDEVAAGEEIIEIEADKANMMHEAETAGVLIGTAVDAEDSVAPGDLLGWVGEAGEAPPAGDSAEPADAPEAVAAPAVQAAPKSAVTVVSPPSSDIGDGRVKSSPLARRVAADLGVVISRITGTGPNGRIVKADVEAAAAASAQPVVGQSFRSSEPEVVKLSRLQSTVARRMVESKAAVPHFYLRIEVDMTSCVAARAELKRQSKGERVPSFNDFVVKAAALTLLDHPKINGAYVGDEWHLFSQIDVGIAVATDDGLLVPVLRGVDRLGLAAIGEESRRLAGAASANELTPGDFEGGTFTVSNLGMYGVSGFDAVVNPPQAAILSVGAIRETVIVKDGEMSPGSVLELGLSCDHRIVYGADGAAFLDDLRGRLENPIRLAL